MSTKAEETGPADGPGWGRRLARVAAALIGLAAMAVFAYWAYVFTLTPVPDPRGWAVGNTEPGRTLRFYLDRPSVKEAAIAIGGNLLLLSPMGVLLPMVSRRMRGPLRLTLLAALVSLGIEAVQGTAVSGRTFDVDDIILNTAGVLLAYLTVGRLVARLVHGPRRSWPRRLLGRA
ncbi:VanZ family protein [Actinocorallia populi]|uniref:VanZ family protein n=1 Tax=Actinocorallia populi TaxID=2079200 RepID=UPI000D092337|nr:VanZ family protein [Actinocorallia populi]